MSIRIKLARLLLNVGSFIKSLPVVIMKPDDLIEFSRTRYAQSDSIKLFSEDTTIERGLYKEELDIINSLPNKSGSVLVLGAGGGREAIQLAKMGFCVTGLDFIPEMIVRAEENAVRYGLKFQGLVQDLSDLDLPENSFDIVWMSRSMYSSIPSRKRRVEMVRRISKSLKPNGVFVCQFRYDLNTTYSKKGLLIRRLIAVMTFGNFEYEPGDTLWASTEFFHEFSSKAELVTEINNGGLAVEEFVPSASIIGLCAICKKAT